MLQKKLFWQIAILILFIFIVDLLAKKYFLYYTIWYFDMIMHFLGGFLVALSSIYFFVVKFHKNSSYNNKDSSLGLDYKLFYYSLSFVLVIGFIWEIYEFIINNILFAKLPFDLLDTISDLFFDLFGGLCAIIIYKIRA